MYEYYETDDNYTSSQMKVFTEWFDKEIGTDYEVNESASGERDQFYCVFVDLTPKEVDKVRAKENELILIYGKEKDGSEKTAKASG